MKRRVCYILFLILSVFMLSACVTQSEEEVKQNTDPTSEETEQSIADAEEHMVKIPDELPEEMEHTKSKNEKEDEQMQELIIEVGGQEFKTTLQENDTAKALLDRLPITLRMEELHGNEKYYYLEEGLPTNAQNPGSIQTGDIMLYGSDCLVLFFEDFSTSFSYTQIGHIEDAQGFADALARGTVEISFRTEE